MWWTVKMFLSNLSDRDSQSLEGYIWKSDSIVFLTLTEETFYDGINHDDNVILYLWSVYRILISVTHLILWWPCMIAKAGIIPCSVDRKTRF